MEILNEGFEQEKLLEFYVFGKKCQCDYCACEGSCSID